MRLNRRRRLPSPIDHRAAASISRLHAHARQPPRCYWSLADAGVVQLGRLIARTVPDTAATTEVGEYLFGRSLLLDELLLRDVVTDECVIPFVLVSPYGTFAVVPSSGGASHSAVERAGIAERELREFLPSVRARAVVVLIAEGYGEPPTEWWDARRHTYIVGLQRLDGLIERHREGPAPAQLARLRLALGSASEL
jgi:hypothetical protein